jgi:hypothetical protein
MSNKKADPNKLRKILESVDERNKYAGTPEYNFGYDHGMDHGETISIEQHKEVIYKMVMDIYGR